MWGVLGSILNKVLGFLPALASFLLGRQVKERETLKEILDIKEKQENARAVYDRSKSGIINRLRRGKF